MYMSPEETFSKTDNRRRSRLDILIRILQFAYQGVKKTHIMYQANLSYEQLKRYLSFLLERDLLVMVEKSNGKEYLTTEKGMQLIRNYMVLNEQLEP